MSVDFFCLFFVILDIVIHVDFALGYYIKQINGHITSQYNLQCLSEQNLATKEYFCRTRGVTFESIEVLECYTNCIYRMLVMCKDSRHIIVVAFLLLVM